MLPHNRAPKLPFDAQLRDRVRAPFPARFADDNSLPRDRGTFCRRVPISAAIVPANAA